MKSIIFENSPEKTQILNPIWIENAEIVKECARNKPYWSVRVHIKGKVEYYSRPFDTEQEGMNFFNYINDCIESMQ